MIRRAYRAEHWQLAAVRRSGHLAIALVGDGRVLEVLRIGARGKDVLTAIRLAVEAAADEYAITSVVVEPGGAVHKALEDSHLELRPLSVKRAVQALFPDGPTSRREIMSALVRREPRLAKHVVILRSNGAVACAPDQRWRTVILLSALLGLAHEAECYSSPTPHVSTSTLSSHPHRALAHGAL